MTSEIAGLPQDGSQQANQPSQRRAWLMLIVLTMLTTAGMTVVLPIMPFVVEQYVPAHGNLALWVGVLETVNALCAFLAAPILGGLSDRIGRRPVIIIAGFGAALGYLLFGIGGAIWMLLLGRIIQGITAGDLPALFAYLADITPAEQRAKRFGLLGALSGIGTMAGPALGGLLAAINVALPVFVTAGIALIMALLSTFVLPESLALDKRAPKLHPAALIAAVNPVKLLKDAFTRVELRGLLIALILVSLPFMFFVNNFSVLALDSIGWNATRIGLLTASVGVIDIIVQGGLLGVLLPRLGERGVIVAGVLGQAAGLLALAIVGSVFAQPWVFILGTLMLAAGQGAATATTDGVLSNAVADDEQGWLAGATQSISSAVGMIAPLMAGVLYARIAHSAPYWLGLLMMVCAAITFARARFASPARAADEDEPAAALA